MTQEEKAKAYDMALEIAKTWHKLDNNDLSNDDLETIFPELKWSKDERIRNWLIGYFRQYKEDEMEKYANGLKVESIIMWLEKQCEQKSILNIPSRDVILSIWDLGNEWKELTNGCISTEYGTQLDYIQKHWHESEYYLKEKQREQKSIDKVESKFHVGDFIVDNCGNVWKIEGILNQFYILEGVDGGESRPTIEWVDKTSHLWTIKDAKEGDILINYDDENQFIFKGLLDPNHPNCPVAYCGINDIGEFTVSSGNVWWEDSNVKPATKEQRDTLEKAMKEAGYEEELVKFLKENLTIEIWTDNECSDTTTEVNVAINLGDETITTSCTYV